MIIRLTVSSDWCLQEELKSTTFRGAHDLPGSLTFYYIITDKMSGVYCTLTWLRIEDVC